MVSNGSAVLRTIAVRCKEVGDRGNMLALRAGIRESAGPLTAAARNAARANLPKRGGLNEHVANGPIRVSTLAGLRSARVRIKALQTDTSQTDKGYVRHPVFPRGSGVLRSTWSWVQEPTPQAAGWWTDTMISKSPVVTAAINARLSRLAAYLEV